MDFRIKRGAARRGKAGYRLAWRGAAWSGRVDGRKPGFDSPATRALGWAGQGCIGDGHGQAGSSMAWQGKVGDWQPSGFEAPTPAPHGRVRRGSLWLGWARLACVGRGVAMRGGARYGRVPATEVDHGLVPWSSPASGRAWLGMAWRSRARNGLAWSGWVRLGPVTAVGREHASRPSAAPGQLANGLGTLRPGGVRNGTARSGPARHGSGGRSSARFDSAPPTPLGVAWYGLARQSKAGLGQARHGFHQGVRSITGVRISNAHSIGAGHGPARQGVALLRLCGGQAWHGSSLLPGVSHVRSQGRSGRMAHDLQQGLGTRRG